MSFLEISDLGCHISVFRGFLILSVKGEEVNRIAIDHLTAIITKAHGITYTQTALVRLAQNNIPVVLTDRKMMPVAASTPLSAHHQTGLIARLQAKAPDYIQNALWKNIVQWKIKHQVAVLKHLNKEYKAINELISRVTAKDKHNIEAQAAKKYWPLILGKDFNRFRDGEYPNDLLNYGYIIIRTAMARSVVAAGLLPALGIFHKNQRNAFCLVDDLIEPYRVFIDLAVLHCIKTGITEMSSQAKKILVSQLQQIVRVNSKWERIETAMILTAQSLVNAYKNKRQQLTFPKPNYQKLIYEEP